jgi:hypothetical protein
MNKTTEFHNDAKKSKLPVLGRSSRPEFGHWSASNACLVPPKPETGLAPLPRSAGAGFAFKYRPNALASHPNRFFILPHLKNIPGIM